MSYGYVWTESERYSEFEKKYKEIESSRAAYEEAIRKVEDEINSLRTKNDELSREMAAQNEKMNESLPISMDDTINNVRLMDLDNLKLIVLGHPRSKSRRRKKVKFKKASPFVYHDQSHAPYSSTNPHPLIEKSLAAVYLLLEQNHLPKKTDFKLPNWQMIRHSIRSGPNRLRDRVITFDYKSITIHMRQYIRRHFLCDTARRIKERRKCEAILDWWAKWGDESPPEMEEEEREEPVPIYVPRDVRSLIEMWAGIGSASISFENVSPVSDTVARLSMWVENVCAYSQFYWMHMDPLKKETRRNLKRIKRMGQEMNFLKYRQSRLV